MKFADFLLQESHLSPSIDDNDVISTLEDLGIFYDRIKENGSNTLQYNFDNRYSMTYDGELFTLFRHGNKIHMENARNKSEIENAIVTWNNSYKLADSELTDEDIDDYLNQLKSDNEDFDQEDDQKDNDEDNEFKDEQDQDDQSDENDPESTEDDQEDKK